MLKNGSDPIIKFIPVTLRTLTKASGGPCNLYKILQTSPFTHENERCQNFRSTNRQNFVINLKFITDVTVLMTLLAPLNELSDEDMDIDTMITTYNTAVTDAASEVLGKERRRKKPWVTKDVLDLCDERRNLKKKRYEAEGVKDYREANRRIQKTVKKAKEDWIGAQCEEIETCLNKNNSKRAYLVKDLTSEKQGRSSTIQDKSGKCLTEEKRFSTDGQNIAQNCTTMRVVETTLYWTAASPRKKICNQSSVRKLRLQ